MFSMKDFDIQHIYSFLMPRDMTYWALFCSCLTGQGFHHHCLPLALCHLVLICQAKTELVLATEDFGLRF